MSARSGPQRGASFSVFADPPARPPVPVAAAAYGTGGAGRASSTSREGCSGLLAAKPNKQFTLTPRSQTTAVKENFDPVAKEIVVYKRTTSTARPLAQRVEGQQRQRGDGRCGGAAHLCSAPTTSSHDAAQQSPTPAPKAHGHNQRNPRWRGSLNVIDRELDGLVLKLAAVSIQGNRDSSRDSGPNLEAHLDAALLSETPCHSQHTRRIAWGRQQHQQLCQIRPPPALHLGILAPLAADGLRNRSVSASAAASRQPGRRARPAPRPVSTVSTPPELRRVIR
ncbi:hypothetical protein LPJ61_000109 [Coemansia biformis]|uniref:Uncharacterized protein n=1 Tax=Coemansia biformis TaxID=1286918 RepID=A0A9W8D0X4_9FUNG|nr:hypothetical protein LPJ61_000109 [Coemansia biformis]